MKLVYVPMVMALVVTTTGFTTTRGPRGRNLVGKMFTLSRSHGGVSFCPSYFSPTPTPWSYTSTYPTQRYETTTTTFTFSKTTTATPSTTYPSWTTYPQWTTYRQWTTAPPTRGVSVCLRYLTDYVQDPAPAIFSLSPSKTPIWLISKSGLSYQLSFNNFNYPDMLLQPNIRFWSDIGPNYWTRLCLTVDSVKHVAQVFSGSSMSVKKILPDWYVWAGEPVINFPGFDGQVTDVQVWNYPLSYREIYNYMRTGYYGPHRGSILTWSSISYSCRGNVVMEDIYEQQAKQSIKGSSRGRGHQLEGKKKTRKFWNMKEKKAMKTQMF